MRFGWQHIIISFLIITEEMRKKNSLKSMFQKQLGKPLWGRGGVKSGLQLLHRDGVTQKMGRLSTERCPKMGRLSTERCPD